MLRHLPLIHALATEKLFTTAFWGAVSYLLFASILYVHLLLTADGLLTTAGALLGGDFFVFRTAAEVAGTPEMAELYAGEFLNELISGRYPDADESQMFWNYPPTMSLLVAPLRSLPFVLGLFAWQGLFLLSLVSVLRWMGGDWKAIVIVMGCPAVFAAFLMGQTGMLTASLLAVAAYGAGTRYWLAGLAAALLTMKPQLGPLIPVAYIASRSWRAFGAAALLSLCLALIALLVFGGEVWSAFLRGISSHSQRMLEVGMPVSMLTTPLGAARLLGASAQLSQALQFLVSVAVAGVVAVVWRTTDDRYLRTMTLLGSVLLFTPYGFYYELPITVVALFALCLSAQQTGWLRGERVGLLILWLASAVATPDAPLPVYFLITASAFGLVVRRVLELVRVKQSAVCEPFSVRC